MLRDPRARRSERDGQRQLMSYHYTIEVKRKDLQFQGLESSDGRITRRHGVVVLRAVLRHGFLRLVP